MWYLIVPPFIVIFGLGVLLWYLSRRMDDPTTIEKMEALKGTIDSGAHSRSLDRKAFFLKLLEKNASRFKTGTLRAHNFFQYSLEGLRAKRKKLDEMRKEVEERRHAEAAPEEKHRFLGGWGRKSEKTAIEEPAVPQEVRKEPIAPPIIQEPGRSFKKFLRRRAPVEAEASVSTEVETEKSFEPTVSRRVATPDTVPKAAEKKNSREEPLIARIAENPRDAVAYEELGDLYFAAKNLQDAKACYRQAIKLHPTNRAVKIKIRRLEKFFEGGAL